MKTAMCAFPLCLLLAGCSAMSTSDLMYRSGRVSAIGYIMKHDALSEQKRQGLEAAYQAATEVAGDIQVTDLRGAVLTAIQQRLSVENPAALMFACEAANTVFDEIQSRAGSVDLPVSDLLSEFLRGVDEALTDYDAYLTQ